MAPDLQKQEMSKKNESWWNETITNLQQLQDPIGESKGELILLRATWRNSSATSCHASISFSNSYRM